MSFSAVPSVVPQRLQNHRPDLSAAEIRLPPSKMSREGHEFTRAAKPLKCARALRNRTNRGWPTLAFFARVGNRLEQPCNPGCSHIASKEGSTGLNSHPSQKARRVGQPRSKGGPAPFDPSEAKALLGEQAFQPRAPEGRSSLAQRFSAGESGSNDSSVPEGRPSSHAHASSPALPCSCPTGFASRGKTHRLPRKALATKRGRA